MKHLYWFVFLLLFSCKSEKIDELLENTTGSPLKYEVLRTIIPIDIESLNEYVLLDSFDENGYNYLYAFNDKSFKIDVFSLDSSKFMKHIPLSEEGPNGINRRIRGLYIHRMDSIFLFASNQLYLVNESGMVKNRFNLSDEKYFKNLPHGIVVMDNNYAVASMKLFYNAEKKSIPLVYIKNDDIKEFYFAEFFIETGEMALHPVKFPAYYEEHKGNFGWMKYPNMEPTTSLIYYNFPILSNMYQYDIKNDEVKVFGGKSRFTNNIVNPNREKTFENMEQYRIKNIHFHEPIFDPFKKLIYRIHVKEMETVVDINDRNIYQKKEMFLTVFDLNFKVLNEIKLKENTYSIYTSWFVNPKGLFLTAYNPYAEDINFEELRFDCYSFY